jgi:hypothetical protein
MLSICAPHRHKIASTRRWVGSRTTRLVQKLALGSRNNKSRRVANEMLQSVNYEMVYSDHTLVFSCRS